MNDKVLKILLEDIKDTKDNLINDILDDLWYETGKCYSEEFLIKEYPEWLKAQLKEEYEK